MNNGLLKIATIENLFREEETPEIHPYSYTHGGHSYKLTRARGERIEDVLFYLGTELESEGSHPNTRAEKLLITHSLPCIMARDASLGSFGVEIVSEPMSFKKWKSIESNVKNMCDELTLAGYKSHDTSTCGLHIHVTRPSDAVIDRILFIMETYKDEFTKFARRSSSNYAKWYSDYSYNREQLKSLEFIKNNKNTRDRYMALNLTNAKTIEFRIVKGTLNGQTFMASLELINNLVMLCSDLSRPVNRITWRLLTEGENCREYCKSRGISKSNIIPKDMTNEQIRLYNANKRKISKIIRVLTNEINKKVSLYQLDIKTNTPSLSSALNKEDFNKNLTDFSRMITQKTNELDETMYVIKNAIQSLENNLKTNMGDGWLNTCVKNYILNHYERFTSASISEIKSIIGGER